MDVVSEALAMASAIEEEREAAAAALAATEKARVDPRVLMQAVLQDTGDVVGAVMAAYDTVLPPYEEAEEEDDDEDEEKDEESDKVGEADGNKRPRARRRKIDPDSLAVGAAVGDSGQELVAAAERVKQESERLKKR